ncbi:tetratricopeptide repeat protein [Lapidilactobacillus bayanensis]|uniref:tetratricopeptide repeat protein n=1 Tax=Lapidilactobacillus bayanensis TaxID=2485998 RepID=UPI000F76E8F0|nr:tetratricopeptide repeat protein [Lapidilactobacillus bayanensis]
MNQEAQALFAQGQRETAIVKLTKILNADPDNVLLLVQLATMLIQVTDLTQAQQLLARAAVLAPEQADIAYNQAVVAHQLQQNEQAIAFLTPILHSEYAREASYLLAVIYFEKNDLPRATVFALTAAEAPAAGLPENLLLTQVFAKQQLWDQSLPYANKILALDPQNADVAFTVGAVFLNTNQLEAGQTLLQQAANDAPKKYGAAVNLILAE